MKGGRKNLKRAAEEDFLNLQNEQSIMQVLSLRGSNLIEVMDAQGEKSLALFPAKFQKSMWIKRGSFVVVDISGKVKALESGSKVACLVSQVLFYEQVRALRKSPEWPEIFRSTTLDDSSGSSYRQTSQQEEENKLDSSDDDGLPPIELDYNDYTSDQHDAIQGWETSDSCPIRTEQLWLKEEPEKKEMAVSAVRGGRIPVVSFFYHRHRHPQFLSTDKENSLRLRKLNTRRSKRFPLFARYSQAQDLFSSRRLQDSLDSLPKLVEDIVQTSINTGPRGALRLAQGIRAFLGVSGEWLADVSKSPNSSVGLPTQMQLGLLSPLYLRRLFERMGATYIKLGQFIASAPTLFPPEYVQEFQNCFDRAPSVPFEDIQNILLEELGRPIESVYEYVDSTPIASASIAQVHGARLKGSLEDVVIKVLKPGIEDIMVADLNFIYVVARILEFLNPEFSRASLVGIVKDIRDSMLEEVDFYKEAANIESFRRYLEAMGLTRQATAPKVYQHCSTRRVLTMQRLYGVPLTDLESISSLVSSPESSLITALNVWFGSLLACESFHADVHAGNLWLLRDGRIGFLDFGIVGRISPKTWAAMEDLDTEIVVETATGTTTRATAVSANLVIDERQMNAVFLDVVRVSESYGLRFPREFALLMKQLLYFDRYTRLLAPNLNMLQDQRISIVSNRRSKYGGGFN
ncbi:hypothetical protein CJ030_MR3G002717 [Morella rubra]|uniref:ABC1 atypical kinase-like domain-containing protein n=1 Tax=Morella rubra TaxID=262757 RepID=A0A6A1W433_9ROSI|nr:hypothetical protein CJ030_MR3G002717 [Morella rubra]